jgi:vibriolysin
MRAHHNHRRALGTTLLLAASCATTAAPPGGPLDDDVADAVARLPGAEVEAARDGVPTFLSGDLGRASSGKLDAGKADGVLPAVLAHVAPAFRLGPADLRLVGVTTDPDGAVHARFRQLQFGFDVEGAELVLHVDATGVVYAANGTARGGGVAPSMRAALTAGDATQRLLASGRYRGMLAGPARLAFVQGQRGFPRLAWEVTVTGERDGEPVEDRVYVDAHTGGVAATHPLVHSARKRRITTVSNGQLLPGIVRAEEGDAPPTDPHLAELHDHIGTSYDCFQALFGRDSYDDKGGTLIGVGHYGVNTQNAFWRGNGYLVFGDGDGVNSGPFGRALDIVAHELTHGVTRASANLVYVNESGAINEAMSDIFGAVCESWKRGGQITDDTWKIGEDMQTPAIPGDALRYMNDPVADRISRDFYPDRYVGTWDNGGVHVNSGIANLAFKLLVTGGRHPRGKSTVQVPAIGMEKARAIFYRVLTTYLTSTSDFADLRSTTMFTANELYGARERQAVGLAFDAVGVDERGLAGAPPVALADGAPQSLGDKRHGQKVFALEVPRGAGQLVIETRGGSGDPDLYVKHGGRPTTYRHDHASTNLASSRELITLTDPQPGRLFILVSAAADYAGVTLVARVTPAAPVALDGGLWHTIAAGKGASRQFTLTVPAGAAAVTFELEGAGGDADLYVRHGAAPTLGEHDAASATAGSSRELITLDPVAGTYHVLVHGAGEIPEATLRASVLVATHLESGDERELAGDAGTPTLFSIDVPDGAHALEVALAGGTGDADVYVQAGSPPTDKHHEHGSFGPSNDELVLARGLVAGRAYLAIVGNGPYAGVRLTVRLHTDDPGVYPLASQRSVNVGLPPGGEGRFTLEVPPTALDGTFALSGGDADLYLRRDGEPTPTSHDLTTAGAPTKRLELAPLPAGVYSVLVKARSAGSSWLTGGFQATPLMREGRGYWISGTKDITRVWRIDVPEGGRGVRVTLAGGSGDPDVYVKKGAVPTMTDHDGASETHGVNDAVTVDQGAGSYWILVVASDEYSLTELKAVVRR